jgi:hypothetical protein
VTTLLHLPTTFTRKLKTQAQVKQQVLLFIFQFNPILVLLMILTVALKITLFCKFKIEGWKFYNVVYFKTSDIAGAKTSAAIDVKIGHNVLTVFLLFLVAVRILLLYFFIC